MDLVVAPRLTDPDGELWATYERAFEDLRTLAVQRHVMYRAEFDALLDDTRISKYLVRDPERHRLAALGAVTNHLDAVPLISPDYFAHHRPEWYAAKRIWYAIFVAVDPDYQGTGALGRMIGHMCDVAAPGGGMICMDVCRHREQELRLPGLVERYGQTFVHGSVRTRMDAQAYWSYETPT